MSGTLRTTLSASGRQFEEADASRVLGQFGHRRKKAWPWRQELGGVVAAVT